MQSILASLLAIFSLSHHNNSQVRYVNEYNKHNYPIVSVSTIAPFRPDVVNKRSFPFLISNDHTILLGVGFGNAITFFISKESFSKNFLIDLKKIGYQTITFAQ